MGSVEEANKVTQFCEICGSDRETAEHVLEAHSWDLDRSIGFFMEHGATMPTDFGAQPRLPSEAIEDPIRVTDAPPERPSAPPPQPVHIPRHETTVVETEEDPDFDPELERALAESRMFAGQPQSSQQHTRTEPREHALPDAEEDDEDDDLQTLANHRANRVTAEDDDEPAPAAGSGMPRGLMNRPHNRSSGRRQPATLDPFLRPPPGISGTGYSGGMPMPLNPAAARMAAEVAAGPAFQPGFDHDQEGNGFAHPMNNGMEDLPAGINVEEARMLEAAMLGIPYEGRIPSFRGEYESQPPSAEALAQRQLRQEQDDAFQQSLEADRAKMLAVRKAEEAEAAAAQAAADQQRQEAEESERKAREHSQLMDSKRSRLPPEPDASSPASVTVAVRMPGGQRISRRFAEQDKLLSLFDWVDLESESAEMQPGSYALVTQYPRQVFRDSHQGSLADAGFKRQQAFLIELG